MEPQGALRHIEPPCHNTLAAIEGIVSACVLNQGFRNFAGFDQATGRKRSIRHGALQLKLEFFPASIPVAVYVPARRQITTIIGNCRCQMLVRQARRGQHDFTKDPLTNGFRGETEFNLQGL